MLTPNQRVKVNLAHLTIRRVHFSENVREVLAYSPSLGASARVAGYARM